MKLKDHLESLGSPSKKYASDDTEKSTTNNIDISVPAQTIQDSEEKDEQDKNAKVITLLRE